MYQLYPSWFQPETPQCMEINYRYFELTSVLAQPVITLLLFTDKSWISGASMCKWSSPDRAACLCDSPLVWILYINILRINYQLISIHCVYFPKITRRSHHKPSTWENKLCYAESITQRRKVNECFSSHVPVCHNKSRLMMFLHDTIGKLPQLYG